MIPTKLTGEEIEELKQQSAAHFWPHARQAGNMSDETGVKVVTKGKGVWVEDVDGKRWFDVISGLWLKNIGHGRTEIAEAVYEQMQNISFSPGGTVSPITIKVAARIASLAPDKDSRIYFDDQFNDYFIKLYYYYTNQNIEFEDFIEKYYMLNCSRQTRLLGRWVKLSKELNQSFYLDFIETTKKRLFKGLVKINRKDLRSVYNKLLPESF